MEARKARLDRALLSSLSRLEGVEECSAVDFGTSLDADTGCAVVDFASWEKRNAPYVLPADLNAFYSMFNGLGVSYRVEIGGKQVPVGEMRLNKLEAICRVALEGSFPKMSWSKVEKGGAGDVFLLDLKTSAAFSIDSSLEIGDVVLLYRAPDLSYEDHVGTKLKGAGVAPALASSPMTTSPYEDPEVWFQDISARWHFVSSSFTNFLRLMVAHVGVYGWHLAYTQEGLPAETVHWMGLFCRERICVATTRGK